MRYLYIVGASGSIGRQTLDIVRSNPNEFKVIGLSLGRDLKLAKELIEEFKPEIVCFRENKCDLSYEPKIVYGDEGLLEVSSYHNDKYDDEDLEQCIEKIHLEHLDVQRRKISKDIERTDDLNYKSNLIVAKFANRRKKESLKRRDK